MANTRGNQKAVGIIFVLLAALGFSLMTFFVKLSGDLPTMQKVFFRNAVAAVIASVTLFRSEEKFRVQKGNWGWLTLRSVMGTLGMIANFWAIDRIGLADSNILNKMSPFFAIIMSYFILKEKANKTEWLSVVVAFVGALFVIKPTSGLASLPAVVGLLGGFCAGFAYTCVRKLGIRGERGPLIVFFFSAFSSLITLPFLIFDYHHMSGLQLLYLVLAGVSAALGQFSITAAYTHAPAKEISVFDYTQVIFAAILGGIFFADKPDLYSIIGYVIIIGTAVFRWYYNLHHDDSLPKSGDRDPKQIPDERSEASSSVEVKQRS